MLQLMIAFAVTLRRGLLPTRAHVILSGRTAYNDLSVTQEFLRADIGRRLSECLAIGWLGRVYSAAPIFVEAFFPAVFSLSLYDDQVCTLSQRRGSTAVVECTLKESSVVARGIPLRLRLEVNLVSNSSDSDEDGSSVIISKATLLALGCDLPATTRSQLATTTTTLSDAEARAFSDSICTDRATKRLVARAVASTMFSKLTPVKRALDASRPLECCGEELTFSPRRDIFAREGSSDKWLQEVSGYYFAEARLQTVRFGSDSGVDEAVCFTFYLDPQEPLNSIDPRRIVNPEVINCQLGDLSF